MKKRILSLILLVATLITAIPVMAVTAADAEAPVVYTNEEYAELYAKRDNLVHLYMAYANADAANCYSFGGTKYWYDLVGGGAGTTNATFRDHNSTWKIEAAGGISSIDDAEDFLALGAERLGTSRVVKAVKELEKA